MHWLVEWVVERRFGPITLTTIKRDSRDFKWISEGLSWAASDENSYSGEFWETADFDLSHITQQGFGGSVTSAEVFFKPTEAPSNDDHLYASLAKLLLLTVGLTHLH